MRTIFFPFEHRIWMASWNLCGESNLKKASFHIHTQNGKAIKTKTTGESSSSTMPTTNKDRKRRMKKNENKLRDNARAAVLCLAHFTLLDVHRNQRNFNRCVRFIMLHHTKKKGASSTSSCYWRIRFTNSYSSCSVTYQNSVKITLSLSGSFFGWHQRKLRTEQQKNTLLKKMKALLKSKS